MYELWFLNYYSTKISDRCFYTVLYMLTLGGGGGGGPDLKETLKGYCCQRKVIVPASLSSKFP